MKVNDRITICITEPERYTTHLFNHIQGAKGTIEREYPKDLLCGNPERYDWLIRLDVPVPSVAAGWPETRYQWMQSAEIKKEI